MAWVEIHQSLPTHRKTLALADALKIEPIAAIGHLTCLWLWALDNAQPDGFMLGASPRTIARAAGWKRDPVVFVDALGDAGFLDGSATLHNWDKYAGRLMERRKKDAERKRTERVVSPDSGADIRTPSGGHPADVLPTSGGSRTRVTVPNRTGPETAPGEPAARVNRNGGVIDAIRAQGIEPTLTPRDHGAIKSTSATPALIAEVYGAVYRGEYGDDFMRKRLSVHEAIEWINGYEAWKAQGRPKALPNGRPPQPEPHYIDRTGQPN